MGKKGKRSKVRDMEPDDVIDEADAPEVLDGPEGFWQEFGPSLEHLRAGKAIVVLTLDRKTGKIECDDANTLGPMETFSILYHGLNQHDQANIQPQYDGYDED